MFKTLLSSYYSITDKDHTKQCEKEQIKQKLCKLKEPSLQKPIPIHKQGNVLKIKKYSSRLNENMNIIEFLRLNFLDNSGTFRTFAEALIRKLASLKSKDKKKFSKTLQLCQNMLIDTEEE